MSLINSKFIILLIIYLKTVISIEIFELKTNNISLDNVKQHSSGIFGSCTTSNDCLGSNTRCFDEKCKCIPSYQWTNQYNCEEFTCTKYAECEVYNPNRLCSNGKCECKDGYRDLPTHECRPESGYIGGYCNLSSDCTGFGIVCVDHKCRCPANYSPKFNLDGCTHSTCIYDSHCTSYDNNRECKSRKCVCESGFIPDISNGNKCKPGEGLVNKPCTIYCMGENTRCIDQTCRCHPPYKPNSDLTDCNYKSCSTDTDCQDYDYNRVCSARSCVCDTGYTDDYLNGRKCKNTYSYSSFTWLYIFIGIMIPVSFGLTVFYYLRRRQRLNAIRSAQPVAYVQRMPYAPNPQNHNDMYPPPYTRY